MKHYEIHETMLAAQIWLAASWAQYLCLASVSKCSVTSISLNDFCWWVFWFLDWFCADVPTEVWAFVYPCLSQSWCNIVGNDKRKQKQHEHLVLGWIPKSDVYCTHPYWYRKNSILLSLHCMKAQWDSLDSRFYWPPCDSFQQALAVKLLPVCCAIPPCAKWHSQVRSSGSTLNPAMSGCKQFQVPDVNLSEECKS